MSLVLESQNVRRIVAEEFQKTDAVALEMEVWL
jgi:hypothetical protein